MTHIALKTVLLASAAICLATAAVAADLPQAAPAAAPASSPQFYAGVNLGYGMGNADHQPSTPPPAPFANGYDMGVAGFILGGQVGAMFKLDNNMVLGIQGDVDWSGINGAGTFTPGPGAITQTINWIATAEGRLGFDAGGYTPYLSAGFALAQGTRTAFTSNTETHAGLSIGAGVVVPVANNVSLDLEYRYQAFQPQTYATGGTPASVALNVSTIRAGLNFSF